MALPTFGVTHKHIRAHFFPQLPGEFSGNSNPTDATVTEMVEAESATLVGKLRVENITATAIDTDGGATMPSAYVWCADTIRLGTAIRVSRAMMGQDPEVVKAWLEQYEARYKDLDERGAELLGDASVPAQDANGPRTHIDEHDLDIGDETLISDVIPRFRRSDVL